MLPPQAMYELNSGSLCMLLYNLHHPLTNGYKDIYISL